MIRSVTTPTSGPPFFRARWHSSGLGPRLSVTTNVGTYPCPCTVSIWLDPGAADCCNEPERTWVITHRSDLLPHAGGTEVRHVAGAGHPDRGDADALPRPRNRRAVSVHDVVELRPPAHGHALPGDSSGRQRCSSESPRTVARDQDLKQHPSVLLYHEVGHLRPRQRTISASWRTGLSPRRSPGPSWEYITWPEYDMAAIRAFGARHEFHGRSVILAQAGPRAERAAILHALPREARSGLRHCGRAEASSSPARIASPPNAEHAARIRIPHLAYTWTRAAIRTSTASPSTATDLDMVHHRWSALHRPAPSGARAVISIASSRRSSTTRWLVVFHSPTASSACGSME